MDPMPKPSAPTPYDLLRERHPEQFSDSAIRPTFELSTNYLRFVLENLTTQHKEAAFENFARLLCQHQVCPNILPQTGPVEGGDNKTNGSTYPVAPELTATWPWYHSEA